MHPLTDEPEQDTMVPKSELFGGEWKLHSHHVYTQGLKIHLEKVYRECVSEGSGRGTSLVVWPSFICSCAFYPLWFVFALFVSFFILHLCERDGTLVAATCNNTYK